jgi:hypothetical protein
VETRIENAIEHKDLTVGAPLDIAGAFDRTIKRAAESMALSPQYADRSVPCYKAGM